MREPVYETKWLCARSRRAGGRIEVFSCLVADTGDEEFLKINPEEFETGRGWDAVHANMCRPRIGHVQRKVVFDTPESAKSARIHRLQRQLMHHRRMIIQVGETIDELSGIEPQPHHIEIHS
jgi:hypothetical protein